MLIEKYNPEKVFSVVHYEGKSKNYMVKRFLFENTAVGKHIRHSNCYQKNHFTAINTLVYSYIFIIFEYY
jgi:hypothetical protein